MLRFSPTAWAKLQYFCHRGETEIGGFGVTGPKDLLRISEFVPVRQRASAAYVAFDDEAVADYFETQVDMGRRPEQFARLWLHTHPGDCPQPSSTDEETFARAFGGCDWAVMFILAQSGDTYARLRFRAGPGGEIEIPVMIDYTQAFGASDHDAWEKEYQATVIPESSVYFEPANQAKSAAGEPLDEQSAQLDGWPVDVDPFGAVPDADACPFDDDPWDLEESQRETNRT